ncbi:MAG: hypothetical protein HY471_01915 [Candidatus Sungbacteria bacterium]|nr:hypothetical protein [Candidatus Sungbacteria bacterium]
MDYYFTFIDFLLDFPWEALLVSLKVAAFLVIMGGLYWYVVTVKRMRELPSDGPAVAFQDVEALPREIVAGPWLEIQEKMTSLNPADWSLAVIQADAVLDKILKASGYIGDTMSDRLKQINPAELSAIDDVWRSHKIRNRLAHGTAGAVTRDEAELAIRGYERAFRELSYIE